MAAPEPSCLNFGSNLTASLLQMIASGGEFHHALVGIRRVDGQAGKS